MQTYFIIYPMRPASASSLVSEFWRTSTEEIYDVDIVGGGGHGLATAYYLARTMATPM